ncbi:MAG TPA: TonB-dependent receptor [Burkholderiaceae bacterium]|nr:TonB-dependent receptor [Burkholderiaceae bacterium]
MKSGGTRGRFAIGAVVASTWTLVHAQADAPPQALPPVEVIGVTPLLGGGIDRDKIPANVQTLSGDEFDHRKSPDLMSTLSRSMPGVSISDQAGNAYQRDVNFRGFVASPIPGTTQGLAAYQNGIRINEAFGDLVNWDFIPEGAIARTALLPSSPIYGLNALGGAVTIEMENGFTHPSTEIELRGGSFGRQGLAVEAGHQAGNMAGYLAVDLIHDGGWRNDSRSLVRRGYGDIGYRDGNAEYHLSLTAASNSFGAAAATPVEMLAQNWSSIFTVPQSTEQSLLFLAGTANWKLSTADSIQANAYYRGFWQSHLDGNGTDAQNQGCPDPTFLCFPDLDGNLQNLTDTSGQPVPAAGALATGVLGEIDRTWTSSIGVGGALQWTNVAQLGEKRFNHLVAGASLDTARSRFTTSSELGTINPDQYPYVVGAGIFIDMPNGDVAPVGVSSDTTYLGVFAGDTFDVTSEVAVTAGVRLNSERISISDLQGTAPAVAGSHNYSRVNPSLGATWAAAPGFTLYGGYSEANRAPTPLELACSDPDRPCLIDNALVADPDLRQVVARTLEAGGRGSTSVATNAVLSWNAGVFSTKLTDDILHIPNTTNGLGYFANVGATRRRGVEAGLSLHSEDVNAYANVAVIDATYLDALTLSSPNNPSADPDGNIFVVPGNHVPGIPRTRVKVGADARLTGQWNLGADVWYVGSQYLIGDDANQNPQVPSYIVVDLRTTLSLGPRFELFAQIQNLFDRRYYTFGTYFDTTTVPYLNLSDPRTFVPGAPRSFFFGVRMTL